MSYTTLSLGGKERGLKFNQLALEIFSKHSDWDNGTDAGYAYAIIYGGLCGNMKAKRETIDFTFEDVTDWVDSLYAAGQVEEIKRACDAFADSQLFKKWMHDFKSKIRSLQEAEATDTEEKKSIA